MRLCVGADGVKGFLADIVLDLAGVGLGGGGVDTQRHQEPRQRVVPIQHIFRDGHAAGGQCNKPVLIHGDIAVFLETLGGVGDAWLRHAEKFGNAGAYITKCTSQLMRDLGCVQSPQNAFILNLGLESLHVRMPRHCENAMAVAQFLEKQPQVASVSYPHLPSSPYYARAMKYMPNGGCGVVSFVLKGGRPAAEAFMKRLTLAAIETHVADARTCCLNPATSTHRQMTEEQLAVAGIPAGMVRISVGLESKDDLIADLAQALSGIEA